MDRGDYYEAKAALLNLKTEQLAAQMRVANAKASVDRIMARVGVPPAPNYSWDDTSLIITPVGR